MSNHVQQATLPEIGFVRLPQILVFIPVCAASWWNGVKSGKYPPSFKLGPKTTAWRVEDIRELLANPYKTWKKV